MGLGCVFRSPKLSASSDVLVVGQPMPGKSSEWSKLECLQKMWSDYRLIKRSACLLAIWSVSRGWEHSGGEEHLSLSENYPGREGTYGVSICHYPKIISAYFQLSWEGKRGRGVIFLLKNLESKRCLMTVVQLPHEWTVNCWLQVMINHN